MPKDSSMAAAVTRAELRQELKDVVTKKHLEKVLEGYPTSKDLAKALEPLATKVDLEKYATKPDLETWAGALEHRIITAMRAELRAELRSDLRAELSTAMAQSEHRLDAQMARHCKAIEESIRGMVRAVDDKYSDLPARVTRLERTSKPRRS